MKTVFLIGIAVLFLATGAAHARSWDKWDCANDIKITLTVSAPHQNIHRRFLYSIEVDGLRDPEKDRVTFKVVPVIQYGRRAERTEVYLNGKRCKEIEQ